MRIAPARLLVPGLLKRHPRLGPWLIGTFRIGLLAFLLAVAVSFYGWRYGLTPLPDPLAAESPPPWPISADELTPAHAWYWVRELGTNGTFAAPVQPRVWEHLIRWSATGLPGWGPLPPEWIERQDNPAFLACLAGAMRSTPQPGRMVEPGFTSERQMEAGALLSVWLVRAAEAEQAGQSAAAFSNLVAGFQLWVRLQPNFAPSGDFASLGARAWRRLTVEGPGVSESYGRSLLAGIEQVQADLVEPAAILGREAWSQWNVPDELTETGLDSQQLGEELYTAMRNVRDEFQTLALQLVRNFGRGEDPGLPDFSGVRHFATPAGVILRGLQHVAAQPADYVRVRDAYFTQIMHRLRAGDSPGARATARQLVFMPAGWPAWRRYLDRPAIWESLTLYPDPEGAVNAVQSARASLESCRLALALRLSRDRSGQWPAALAELTPAILSRVPLDPYTGDLFRYCRQGELWGIASPGAGRTGWRGFRGFLFLSDDPARARRNPRTAALSPNLALLLRYGIARLVPDPDRRSLTNLVVPFGMEVSTNELAVLRGLDLLPPNLRLVVDPNQPLPGRPARRTNRPATSPAPFGEAPTPSVRSKPG